MLSAEVSNQLENTQPETAGKLREIIQLAPQSTDPELLELCSGYIDAALQHQNWTPPGGGLDEKQQAFIDFTEQFASSVGSMSDEQVQRLLDFATADEVYDFVNALYVVDMARRLDLVAGRVLA